VSPPNQDGPGFLDKLKALVSGAPTNEEFDPIAVGNEIKSHLDQADKAVAANREHSVAAGALLYGVQREHPEDMDAICKRIGLSASRRKELLMIAGGRKTLEQSRAENAERQRRHKAKKKQQKQAEPTTPKQPTQEPTGEPGPITAEPVNVEPTSLSTEPLPGSVTANDPAPSTSKKALAEFTFACRTWLPKMDDGDRAMAIQFCNQWRGKEAA
jgi:hypothetical protein